jgi:hypothetical protein
MHPSSTLHSPFTIKKIDFKQKGVSNVTSETFFCLKSIFLSKRSGQRKNEGKIFSISQHYFPYANAAHPCLNSFGLL